MRVRVSHDEESECSNPEFDARYQHSVNGLQNLETKAALLVFSIFPFLKTRL